MSATATILWLLCLIIDSGGQLIFKAAAIKTSETDGIKRWKAILSNVWIWIGLSAYVLEFLLWMAFLALVPLGQAVFVRSVNIITIMIGGRIFFWREIITQASRRHYINYCRCVTGRVELNETFLYYWFSYFAGI